MASIVQVLVALLLCLTILQYVFAEPTEPCGDNVDWKLIPDDRSCSIYYTCSYGVVSEKFCPPGQSFYKHMCFDSFSKNDLCNRPVVTTFIRSRRLQSAVFRKTCEPGETGVFPHPTKCAQYFNCSDPSTVTGIIKRQFLKECPHPLLFDTTSRTCRHHSVVNCGNGRDRPATECDYIKNQCLSGNAMPCAAMNPSCDSLPDGANSWPGRLGSPEYIMCTDEQLKAKVACNYEIDESGFRRLTNFNPATKRCEVLPGEALF